MVFCTPECSANQLNSFFIACVAVVSRGYTIASFPGPARSSLAVRNSRRGPGLAHHVMRAADYVTTLLLESMMS